MAKATVNQSIQYKHGEHKAWNKKELSYNGRISPTVY